MYVQFIILYIVSLCVCCQCSIHLSCTVIIMSRVLLYCSMVSSHLFNATSATTSSSKCGRTLSCTNPFRPSTWSKWHKAWGDSTEVGTAEELWGVSDAAHERPTEMVSVLVFMFVAASIRSTCTPWYYCTNKLYQPEPATFCMYVYMFRKVSLPPNLCVQLCMYNVNVYVHLWIIASLRFTFTRTYA